MILKFTQIRLVRLARARLVLDFFWKGLGSGPPGLDFSNLMLDRVRDLEARPITSPIYWLAFEARHVLDLCDPCIIDLHIYYFVQNSEL